MGGQGGGVVEFPSSETFKTQSKQSKTLRNWALTGDREVFWSSFWYHMCCGDLSLPSPLNCRFPPVRPLQLPTCTRMCLSSPHFPSVHPDVSPTLVFSRCPCPGSPQHSALFAEFLFDRDCCFPDFSGCWWWVPPVTAHLQTLILHATCSRLHSAGASGATGDHPVKAKLLVVFSHEGLLIFSR